jgi:hypothetical protein
VFHDTTGDIDRRDTVAPHARAGTAKRIRDGVPRTEEAR